MVGALAAEQAALQQALAEEQAQRCAAEKAEGILARPAAETYFWGSFVSFASQCLGHKRNKYKYTCFVLWCLWCIRR